MFANYVTGQCLECKPEYLLNNFSCTPKPKVENCLRINAQDLEACDLCEPNYFTTAAKKCEPVSELCAEGLYDPSNGRCLVCIEGL